MWSICAFRVLNPRQWINKICIRFCFTYSASARSLVFKFWLHHKITYFSIWILKVWKQNMGEFKLFCNTDLRYLYSGKQKSRPTSSVLSNSMFINKGNVDVDLRHTVLNTTQYERQLTDFQLTRAPAFRNFSRHEVKDLVDRLYGNPRKKGEKKGKLRDHREDMSYVIGSKPLSKIEITAMIIRLSERSVGRIKRRYRYPWYISVFLAFYILELPGYMMSWLVMTKQQCIETFLLRRKWHCWLD